MLVNIWLAVSQPQKSYRAGRKSYHAGRKSYHAGRKSCHAARNPSCRITANSPTHRFWQVDPIMLEKKWGKSSWLSEKVEIRKAEFLAVGKARKAVFGFTQGFTEGVLVFSGEGGLNFCVRGALPRGCVRGSSAWLSFVQSHTPQDCLRHTLGNDQLNGYVEPSTREWWFLLLLVSYSCVQLHWVTTIDSYPKSRIFYVHILNRIAWTHSEPLYHKSSRCTKMHWHIHAYAAKASILFHTCLSRKRKCSVGVNGMRWLW